MTRIVTSTYRYKPPPRKREAVDERRACASYASSRMLVHDNWAVVRVTPSAADPGYPRFDGERR
jgi:hypothetical protein